MIYLVVVATIFGVNLLPALGPPTWAVLMLFYLHGDTSEFLLVPVGALSAAAGRLTLAHATRRLGAHLPAKQRRNLAAAGSVLLQRRTGSIAALALFALSPVPSAQLFEAAGLMQARLSTLTAAFFAGRLASYSLYLGGAHAVRDTSAADLIRTSLTSPIGWVVQVGMLALLVALGQINWRPDKQPEPEQRGDVRP